MKTDTIRTSLDIPRDLHRRLREKSARTGKSARQIILSSIERDLEEPKPVRYQTPLRKDDPIVPSRGRKPFNLTNEEIYEFIEIP